MLEELIDEVNQILGDSGGPGEFKYDGGPKPYVKKDGTVSKKSKERVEEHDGGGPEAPEAPATVPFPTEEQQEDIKALIAKYYASQEEEGEDEDGEFSEDLDSQVSSYNARVDNLRKTFPEDAKVFDSIHQTEALTEDEEGATNAWFNSNEEIQKALLNPDAEDSYYPLDLADRLSSVISKHELSDDIEVSRGIHLGHFKGENYNTKANRTFINSFMNAQPGDILGNELFSSTTPRSSTAEQYGKENKSGVTLSISLKRGQHAYPIPYSIQPEILLDKDSKFKVDSVDKKSRTVKMTLLDKDPAVDSIALDYTFIPEEHPRQKDPDWGGKGDQPSESKPSTVPFPTGGQLDAASDLVKNYYAIKANRPPSVKEGGTPQDSTSSEPINTSWSKEEEAEISKLFPGAHARYKEWLPIRFDRENPRATELRAERTAQHAIVEMWQKDYENSPEGQAQKAAETEERHKQYQIESDKSNETKNKALKKSVPAEIQHFWQLYTGEKFSDKHKSELYDFIKWHSEFSGKKYDSKGSVLKDIWKDASHFKSSRALSEEEKNVVNKYQLGDEDLIYGIIGNSETEESKKRSDVLSKAIHTQKITKNTTLFRGLVKGPTQDDSSDPGGESMEKYFNDMLNASPGDEIHNRSFSATSMEENFAADWADLNSDYVQDRGLLLKIDVDAGTPALNITPSLGPEASLNELGGSYLWQREVLLDKNSKFKINSVDKAKRMVHVSYIHGTKAATDSAVFDITPQRDLEYVIETPKGQLRHGRGFISRAPADYGYIVGYTGADGDEMDCYLGPNMWVDVVYVVDQNRMTGPLFDEHKCMIGFSSEQEAKRIYLAGHTHGSKIFRGITRFSKRQFLHWLNHGDLTKPLTQAKKVA